MNIEDILGAFLLVNNPIVLSEKEIKDVQKAIKKLQQENKKLEQTLDEIEKYIEEHQEERTYTDRGGFTCTDGHFLRDSDDLLKIIQKAKG